MIPTLCILLGLACGAEREHPHPHPSVSVRAPVQVAARPRAAMVQRAIRTPDAFPPSCPALPPAELRAHFVAAARRYPGGSDGVRAGEAGVLRIPVRPGGEVGSKAERGDVPVRAGNGGGA